MAASFADMRRYIIGFRATVRHAHVTFKLGQDEDARTFDEITTALGSTPLALWMSGQRDPG